MFALDRVFEYPSFAGWRGIHNTLDTHLIIFVLKGKMEVFVDNQQLDPIPAGSYRLIPQGSSKYIFCDVETFSIRLRFNSDSPMDAMYGSTPHSALTLLNLLHERSTYPHPNITAQEHMLSAIIYELQQPSAPILDQSEEGRNQFFIQWVKQALRGESNINQGANALDISPDHFSRLFKKQYGQTPKAHIMEQRFQQALTILGEENISTKELAKRVGLDDSALFCKQFKQRFGRSPQDYRP